jgi:glycosyltransferase involved in cell wall biosynthesis
MNLYFFGWPSFLGGADTKLVHVLRLLREHYKVTVVPNDTGRLQETYWMKWLAEMGIEVLTWEALPTRLRGWGVAFCNGWMMESGRIAQLQDRGLKFAWSNDMMWHIVGELGLIMAGTLDHLIYVSEVQRQALEPLYRHAWTGLQVPTSVPLAAPGTLHGCIPSPDSPKTKLRWVITGNYIDPEAFPFVDRWRKRAAGSPLVVGRLSRPDPVKFPYDFPASYEGLRLQHARFSVMGWSAQMAARWPNHTFDARWTILEAGAMPSVDFLQTLDLFVYDLSPDFRESWGRAVVEAMLTGAIPIVPQGGGHHLDQLVPHGKAGFLCASRADFGRYARLLEKDPALCARISRAARRHAAEVLNNAAEHRQWWDLLFKGK